MKFVALLAGTRQPKETCRAAIACNDYLMMGSGRSLPALLEQYLQGDRIMAASYCLDTLRRWSASFSWKLRAEEYDDATRRRGRG